MAEGKRARITLVADDKTGPAFASVRQRFDGVSSDLASLTGRFAGFAGALSPILAGTMIAGFAKSIADGLDKFNDLADATGASVENLSGLEAEALRTGTSFETVSATLLKLNQALNNSDNPEVARVLKAVGLSAKELKALDPAEALLQTAKAFDQFAADGSRARAEQVLFGRSLRDVAPLLKDLAEAGGINATVTTAQAQAAEDFNKNLAGLQVAAVAFGRSIFNDAVPALNAIADGLRVAGKEADSFTTIGAVLRTVIQSVAVFDAYVVDTFAGIGREIGAVGAQVAALATLDIKGFKAISEALHDDNERAKRELDKFVSNVLGAQAAVRQAGGGRGFINPASVQAPSLGGIGGGGGGNKAAVSQYDQYIDRLRDALRATQNLSTAEQIRVDIVAGKLGNLTEEQRAYAIELANVLDLAKQPAALVGPEIAQSLLDERKKDAAELRALIDAAPAAKFDALVASSQKTIAAMQAGGLATEDYRRAMETLGKAFEDLEPKFEKVSTFADQAARNIQDAMGDTVLQTLEGNFSRIGDLWANLLKRMVAQAIASNVGSYLFGSGKGGNSGALGGLIAAAFGGARAMGGPVQAGRAYLVGERGPELMVPSAAGTVVPNAALAGAGGPAVYITNNVHAGVTRNEVTSALQLAMQSVKADIFSALRAQRVI